MQNYHRHTSYSNIMTPDSAASNEDYAKRAVELGQKVLSSVEHGWQGYYYEAYELAQKYDLKFIFGTEAYWVGDNQEKDKSNNHIIILAKNEQGRREINTILSDANIDGYYFKPRVDKKSILSLSPGNVFITTACVAFWNYGFQETEDFVRALYDRFGDDFKLEVQYHDTPRQKELNSFLFELKRKYHIGLIAGLDSHYVYPEQTRDRQYRLEASKINYPEEDGWFMDYPDEETTIERFKEQGILTDEDIAEAMDASDALLEFEDITFSKDIKLPVPRMYKDKTKEERAKIYSKLITKQFKEYMQHVPESEYQRYFDGVKEEVNVYKNTGMCDYPLIDYEIIKKGVEMGGIITYTGRGCFTENAIALTLDGIKSIKDVQIGDYVIDMNGRPQKVTNTMMYSCNEEMVQINYAYGSAKNPLICTKDHKILVQDQQGETTWKQAKDLVKGDMVCAPRIQFPNKAKEYIDLNDFNDFGYEYDNDYIYEYRPSANGIAKYSTVDVAKHIGCSKAWVQQIIDHPNRSKFRKPEYVQKLLDYTGFDSLDEYRAYIKDIHTIKISRFIKNDELFNFWIGTMYGDGWALKGKKNIEVGLAVCTDGHKQENNKEVFLQMAKRFNISCSVNKANGKRLEQLRMRSKLINNFVTRYMFSSQKGATKKFNPELFYQNINNLSAILDGLFMADGSAKDGRICFDNTSTSLVGAYKILTMATTSNITSTVLREAHVDYRGFTSKTCYKIRSVPSRKDHPKSNYRTSFDENYVYLPVWSIKNVKAKDRKVYDISVENSHSYVLDNIVVHNSAPSFFTNTLCGFSNIDRFISPIKLYPERFMSETRILETHSLPDIDMNLGTPEIFEKAQEIVMGEGHAYPMIAFGTLKKKSAFKMLARATNMDFELANTISKQIDNYETDLKHAEDEDKDMIDIFNYVDPEYHEYIKQSEKYWGIIDNKKKAPCAYLLYDGDIKSEIGLIKCKTESTKREYITTVIDGAIAEKYKFLKNDLLKVNTVLLTRKVFERLGMKQFTVPELSKTVEGDDKTWKIYSNGWTQGINQCEQASAVKKVVRYKPKNISELAAFIAGIRPGFKSMYDKFESREPFSYGIKQLDDLLQTEQFPYSYILYQEQLMAVLNYAGFQMDQCYQIIKDIAKKHPEKVLPLKDKFLDGFSAKIEQDCSSKSEAEEMAQKVWQVIYDNTSYGFNSSHAYAMALDSLYGAWQKANHPYEFYEVYLQFYTDEGEKDKVAAMKQEMEKAFGIKEGDYKWGIDNRYFKADPDHHQMIPALTCIKGISLKCAEALYELSRERKFTSFAQLIQAIDKKPGVNTKSQLEALIKINYFEQFGDISKLLQLQEAYHELNFAQFNKNTNKDLIQKYGKIITDNSEETPSLYRNFNKQAGLEQYERSLGPKKMSLIDKLSYELEVFGYIKTRLNCEESYVYVLDVNKKYKNKVVTLYRLKTGEIETVKIKGARYDHNPIEVGDIIKTIKAGEEKKWKPDGNGGFTRTDELETILYEWSKVNAE